MSSRRDVAAAACSSVQWNTVLRWCVESRICNENCKKVFCVEKMDFVENQGHVTFLRFYLEILFLWHDF